MNAHAMIDIDQRTRDPSKFTSREFRAMVEAKSFGDLRVELVDGELRKMMPSGWAHGEGLITVASFLREAVATIGARVGGDVIIEIAEGTTRAADISVVKPGFTGTKSLRGDDLLLAVEIADSSLALDLGEKSMHYASCSIPNYWVVDVNSNCIHVMSGPTDQGYSSRSVIRFGEPLAVPGTDRTIVID